MQSQRGAKLLIWRLIPETIVPENTDYAGRAKALVKKTKRAGALVIMPIGLALQAHAAVVLPASATCNPSGGCSASATPLAEQNGLEGLSLVESDSTYGVSSSGGSGEDGFFGLDDSGLLTIDTSGSNCNGVGQPCQLDSFLLSFNFDVRDVSGENGQPLPGNIITSYDSASLNIQLDGTTLFSEFLPGTGQNVTGIGIGGSATVPIPAEFQSKVASLVGDSGGGSVDLSASFSFGFTTRSPGSQSLDLSAAGLSITAVNTAAPEPATTGLAMGGLLGLFAWRRRRRRA